MSLIACRECGSEVSSQAQTCPKCGVRVKPPSKTWVWVLGVPAGLVVLFLLIGAVAGNSPEAKAKQKDRSVLEMCLSDLNDPLKSPAAKATIVRPVCEKMKDDFIRKYGHAP